MIIFFWAYEGKDLSCTNIVTRGFYIRFFGEKIIILRLKYIYLTGTHKRFVYFVDEKNIHDHLQLVLVQRIQNIDFVSRFSFNSMKMYILL